MLLDLFNLAKNIDVKEYHGMGATASSLQNIYTWTKPRGASMVLFFLVGGGGGGGNGRSGTSGSNRGGGGAGGSGGIIQFMAPAILLPDYIQVYVGSGGTAASAGGLTSIGLKNAAASGTAYRYVSATGGNPGTSSTGTTGGAGGNGGTPAVSHLAYIGIYNSYVGIAGASGGGSTANGGSITGFVSNVVHGGCGGAGTDSSNTTRSGGSFTGNSFLGSVDGGSSAGQAGGVGSFLLKPFCSSPGAGGASNGTGTGGAGGNAGIGSGGGGGGAGTTGGAGGSGGPGYCLIATIF